MSKARLYFTGDNGVQKADREYGLTQEIVQKVNNIPGVVDNTSSTSATDALSANMGRDLQEQINNLSVMGRFLSTRNAATGLPDTDPQTSPYVYVTGDYYVVSTVATGGADNYRPNGSSYTIGVASQTVESETLHVNDLYVYDGTIWKRKDSTLGTSVTWGTIVGTLSNQTDLQTELNSKADVNDSFKKFYVSNGDYATVGAQIATWLNNTGYVGNNETFRNAMILDGGFVFIRQNTQSTSGNNYVIYFQGVRPSVINNNDGTSKGVFQLLRFEFSYTNSIWVYVSYDTTYIQNITSKYLRADYNYATAYSPLYDGSPATKKYVDDVKPISGSVAPASTPTFVGQEYVDTTNDKLYVATGTSSSSDWMEVGNGGGAEIEYKTQAEYNALLPGAESDGKHYFIYHTTGGGGGWQPGANTLAYYPFDTDILDHSSNSRALTGDTGTKGTIGYTFTSNVKILNADLPSNVKFINFRCKFNSASGSQGVIVAGGLQQLCMSYYAFGRNQGSPSGLDNVITAFVGSGWSARSHAGPNDIYSWHNICLGYDGTDTMCAIDGVKYSLNSGLDPSAVTDELYLLLVDAGMACSVELADFIVESQGWASQEISDYYDNTKSKFGIN